MDDVKLLKQSFEFFYLKTAMASFSRDFIQMSRVWCLGFFIRRHCTEQPRWMHFWRIYHRVLHFSNRRRNYIHILRYNLPLGLNPRVAFVSHPTAFFLLTVFSVIPFVFPLALRCFLVIIDIYHLISHTYCHSI